MDNINNIKARNTLDLTFDELEKMLPKNKEGRIIGEDMYAEPGSLDGPKDEDVRKAMEEYFKDHPEAKKEFEDNAKKLAGYGEGAIMANPLRNNGPATDAIYFWDM